MNEIDATDRTVTGNDGPLPSLLTIILDTNPHAWAYLHDTLPLQSAIANLLVFINAHLAFDHANQVAVLASHSQQTHWLYPTPEYSSKQSKSGKQNGLANGTAANGTSHITEDDANKYRPFRTVEQGVLSNLADVMSSTTSDDLSSTTTTMIAGALTTALAYINKQETIHSPPDLSLLAQDTGMPTAGFEANEGTAKSRETLTSRMLVVSVSGDLQGQYIPIMNAIFAAQRKKIPIDVLKLAGDTVFLQQACDATGGVYLAPNSPEGLLQYLMMGFLPDATARKHLILPTANEVDFRAACFCHRKVVNVGYVCSVCLSIFCEPIKDATCLTCSSKLDMKNAFTPKPALIPRRKKKRRPLPGGGSTSGAATPSGAGTPGPS